MAVKKQKKNAQKKKHNSSAGRPSVMTPAVVGKLELGFARGLNKTECCQFAGISRDALYGYINAHPEFTDRITVLQSYPSMRAKLNIVERIDKGDIEQSQWWLERRSRDEFSLKQSIDANVREHVKLEDLI